MISHLRGFERNLRVQALLGVGIIQAADEVPAQAIPATVEVVSRWRANPATQHRPPFYQEMTLKCVDCGRPHAWPAADQRYWYEMVHGSAFDEVWRCSEDLSGQPFVEVLRCPECQRKSEEAAKSAIPLRPPTADELVGQVDDRPHDAPFVLEHFLGLTQAEAAEMLQGRMHFLGEAFAWMAPAGLEYYLPALIEHFSAGPVDYDACEVLPTFHRIITSPKKPPSPEMKRLIKAFAACVRTRVPDLWEWESILSEIERA
jgi:hypothetical protein